MSTQTITLITALVITIAFPLILNFGFKMSGTKMKKVLGINLVMFFSILATATVMMMNGSVFAEGEVLAVSPEVMGWGFLSMAIVTGLACVGAGIAVSAAAAAALGALSEDPAIMGKALIFVALAEGIPIYGLLIAFSILGKLG